MTYGRLVVFSGYSGFLHQQNWPPLYNWNIVQSGVQHHNPNPWYDNLWVDMLLHSDTSPCSKPTSLWSSECCVVDKWKSSKYQFKSLWFDLTGVWTHNLSHSRPACQQFHTYEVVIIEDVKIWQWLSDRDLQSLLKIWRQWLSDRDLHSDCQIETYTVTVR